jgi:hypothetical protein
VASPEEGEKALSALLGSAARVVLGAGERAFMTAHLCAAFRQQRYPPIPAIPSIPEKSPLESVN